MVSRVGDVSRRGLVARQPQASDVTRSDRRVASVSTFLVLLGQSGPKWEPSVPLEEQSGWDDHARFMDRLVDDGFLVLGGPLPGRRVAHVVEADSIDTVRETLAADPWSGSHLIVDAIEPWTIRLDARRRT